MDMMIDYLARWGHFLFGITWIGVLYYFNFIPGEYCKEAAGDGRYAGHATMCADITCDCPADLDFDGNVGLDDLLILLDAWGEKGSPADLDGSGTVGWRDLLMLLAAWGPCA